MGSSAELNTFLLLVSPLQCRRHGGEYLAGTASVLYRSAEALKSAEPSTGSELDGVSSPPVEAGVGEGESARFADFPLCGGADEAEQAWRIDQGSYLPKIESPGAAAPTADFGSVSVWVWKRLGSSAELNTFLLLVSPLQCLGTPVDLSYLPTSTRRATGT